MSSSLLVNCELSERSNFRHNVGRLQSWNMVCTSAVSGELMAMLICMGSSCCWFFRNFFTGEELASRQTPPALVFRFTSQNRATRDLGSIWVAGLVVQLSSAAVADVAGSHAATTVTRQTALRFRHFDEVVTDSVLQSVELPFTQPFHNSESRTMPWTTALRWPSTFEMFSSFCCTPRGLMTVMFCNATDITVALHVYTTTTRRRIAATQQHWQRSPAVRSRYRPIMYVHTSSPI